MQQKSSDLPYQYTALISDLWPNGAVAITGAQESRSCEKGQQGHLLSLKQTRRPTLLRLSWCNQECNIQIQPHQICIAV